MKEIVTQKVNWKRLGITIAIVLFTALIISGTTWYILNEQVKEDKIASEKTIRKLQMQLDELTRMTVGEEDNLSAWKTYENEKYGFSFKYPSDFLLKSIDYQDCEDLKKNNIDCEYKEYDKGIYLSIIKNDTDKTEYIMVNTEKDLNLEAWIDKLESNMGKQPYEGGEIEPKITSKESLKIAGLDGYKITVEGRPYTDQVYAFYYNGYVFTFKDPIGSMGDNYKITGIRETLASVVDSVKIIK